MTLVSEIITDAHRISNILAIGEELGVNEYAEGLRYLNRIVKSVFGNEVGNPLQSFPIGRGHIERPSGYPWWDQVPSNDWFVPKNLRLMLNLTGPQPLYLHPDPDDGSRFAMVDVGNNLSTNPVTVYGNGRLFENQFDLTISTDGYDAEWFYRADLGNWLLCSPLALDSIFPFPEEFDDFFVTLLAIRINPSYGVEMDPQAKMIFDRSRSQLRAKYAQHIQVRSELALIRTARVAADRDRWGRGYWYYQPNAMFDKGWPW